MANPFKKKPSAGAKSQAVAPRQPGRKDRFENAFSVSCDMPSFMEPDAADKPVVKVFSSITDKTVGIKPGQSRSFTLMAGEWLKVWRLSYAPTRLTNTSTTQLVLEEPCDEGDVLEDVLSPRQSRTLMKLPIGTKLKVTV